MKSSRMYHHSFLLSLLLFASSAHAELWTGCHGCAREQEEQAAVVAASASPTPSVVNVYVADKVHREVLKFEVLIDREPGLFVTTVTQLQTGQAQVDAVMAFWGALDQMKRQSILSTVCARVVYYIYDAGCQGRVSQHLHYGSNTVFGDFRRDGAILLNRLNAAFNFDRPFESRLYFSDGSVAVVEIRFAMNVVTMTLSVHEVKLIRAYADDGTQLPLTPEQLAGFTLENASIRTVEDMTRLFRAWGVTVVRGCSPLSNRTRMRCERVPPPGSPDGTLPRCTVTTGC